MTPEKIKEALDACDEAIQDSSWGAVRPERFPVAHAYDEQRSHLRWMIIETKKFVDEGRLDKAFRWLGFIQGACWSMNIMTIEQAKRMNMPEGETFKS